ncbi:hypothetical protein AB0D11_47115, partial [Streptomyces monashensis]
PRKAPRTRPRATQHHEHALTMIGCTNRRDTIANDSDRLWAELPEADGDTCGLPAYGGHDAGLERAEGAFEAARPTTTDHRWVAGLEQYEPVLDALETSRAAYKIGNSATALGVILAVFERHVGELAGGWFDAGSGEAIRAGTALVPRRTRRRRAGWCSPRARGIGPRLLRRLSVFTMWSPRTRGWTRHLAPAG